jgi:hypothetical protein
VEGDKQITESNIVNSQHVGLEQEKKYVRYDLCIVWNWEYDLDFINILEKVCKGNNLSLLQITPKNSDSIFKSLNNGEIGFGVYLDRATDVDLSFMPFVNWANEHGVFRINPYANAFRSSDKALMHPDFIYNGLYTPYTIILPSYNDQPVISDVDLKVIGEKFIIKPAHGSGGEGVVLKATSLNQVREVRKEHPNDKYLLQATIVPIDINSHPAWFRVLYCNGHVYLNWWNPKTKIYFPVTEPEEQNYNLAPLRQIASTISRISGLQLFSTEIAYTSDNLYVVIDYVNDPLDLRIQSKAADGVPDKIVHSIAENIVELVLKNK